MATDLSQFTVPNDRFDVAQDNAAKLDSVVNGPNAVVTTRTGKGVQSLDRIIASIAAVTDRGPWATATSYQVKDLVTDTGVFYIAVTAHTSGATFAGDIANWRVYQGVTQDQGDVRYGVDFQTIGALVAQSLPAGLDVKTQEYSTGSGGGGEYITKTAAQAVIDGDIIDEIGSGFTLANSNVAVLQGDRGVTLAQFGSTLSGLTAALTAFKDVSITSGAYNFDVAGFSGLTVQDGGVLRGVGSPDLNLTSSDIAFYNIFGLGSDSKIKDLNINWTTPVGSAGIIMFNLTNEVGNHFSGLSVDCGVREVAGAQNAPNHLFSASGSASNVVIINNTFSGFKFGVLKTNTSTAINEDWLIEGNTFKDFFSPAVTFNTPGGDWDNVRVINNLFKDNLAHTIGGSPVAFPHMGGVAGSSSTSKFVFSNNNFSGFGQGLHFEEGSGEVVISGNTFSITDIPMQIIDNNVGGVRLSPGKFVITGNSIRRFGSAVTDTVTNIGVDIIFDGALAAGLTDSVISNNIIFNYDRAMQLDIGGEGIVVSNNLILDCPVGIRAPKFTSSIHSNTFKGCSVGVEAISSGGMIGSCKFIDCTTELLDTGGTGLVSAELQSARVNFSLPIGVSNIPMMTLPSRMEVVLTFHLEGGSSDRFGVYNLNYDGVTLTGGASPLVSAGSGSIFSPSFNVSGGFLNLSINNATASIQNIDAEVALLGGLKA